MNPAIVARPLHPTAAMMTLLNWAIVNGGIISLHHDPAPLTPRASAPGVGHPLADT
jgi:hypothetical protein